MTSIITRFALLFVIAAALILAATGNLFSSSPLVIALQLLAVALSVWARSSFPHNTFRVEATPAAATVIRKGPYRFIRHPMYSATLLFLWASILSHPGLWTIVIGIAVTAIIAWRIILEEGALRQRYPDYEAYIRETKAVLPYLL